MSEKVLVTGGAGFIGSHVVDEALSLGMAPVVLDDLSGGFVENINPNVTFVNGTIIDKDLVNDLFKEHNFSYVYHLAAYAAEGLSHFIRRFNYENNLIGSINLINAAINNKVKCFVFTSSIAVYGKGQLPMTENMMPVPEDPYGISKLAVEQDLRVAHDMFGLNYVIFRPHNVYGERQNIGDKYRNVIGIFMNQIMEGKELSIFGNGQQTRAFSYIKDVASTIARAPRVQKAYNNVFNVGADTPYSVNDLAGVVCKVMGVDSNVKHFPARNEVIDAHSDHSKVKEIFGITSTPVDLENGVSRMALWAKRVGVRKSKVFKNIEIAENLPAAWR
jgi:UDP-glucose 4-epimerase